MLALSYFHYRPALVALSISLPIFASYAAFEVVECAASARSQRRQIPWSIVGGMMLGGGIWSMHFVGILALELEFPVRYDIGQTLASLAIVVLGASVALFQVAQPEFKRSQRLTAAAVMGSGAIAMHAIGMKAMRVPAQVEVNPTIMLLSIAIAVSVSGMAQEILRQFERIGRARESWRWYASVLMGSAIAIAHYTAMLGVRLIPLRGPSAMPLFADSIDSFRLAELIGVGMLAFCGIALVVTLGHRRRTLQRTLRDLQSTQMRLIQAEKLSSIGQLSAGISHEINNPLSFIKGNLIHLEVTLDEMLTVFQVAHRQRETLPAGLAEQLEDFDWDFVGSDLPKSLGSMHNGIERIQSIVRALEVFTSCNESELKEINLCDRIEDTLKLFSRRFASDAVRPGITVERQYDPLPRVECCSGEILQAPYNLLENAVEAIEQRWAAGATQPGRIAIAAQARREHIYIGISDTGASCDPKRVAKLFEPFFTTKGPGQGTGLGLTLALQAVRSHGGTLGLTPNEGGMLAEITLPLRVLRASDPGRTGLSTRSSAS